MDVSKRKGFVIISKAAFDTFVQNTTVESPFKYFYPSDIKYEYITDTFVFYGYSKLFKELADYAEVPEYSLEITKIENKTYSYDYVAILKENES